MEKETESITILNQVNPDPYVECDPEVDIDKNQAEEDANYFDEDDLGLFLIISDFLNHPLTCREYGKEIEQEKSLEKKN